MIKDNILRIKNNIDNIKNRLNINYNIELMAVTKTRPLKDVEEAINSGINLFGENRIIEAYEKFNNKSLANYKLDLHIIGHLQRNKAKKAIEIASMIQSIDKIETLDTLEAICKEKNKKIDYLIEINTSFEQQKDGVNPDDITNMYTMIDKKKYKFCNLRGVMTVGPLTSEKNDIRKAFRLLYKIYDAFKNKLNKNDFNIISMGMSGDYEIAIEEGSNLLRIGSLIFGSR